ncbi:MAG: thymidylate synthase [Candidatus Paceibacterota bacterium]
MYLPYKERTLDHQYADRLRYILTHGIAVKDTPQDVGALTCFGELTPMVFDVENGAPLITERNVSFWRKPIGEILAFINGVRDTKTLREEYGVAWWEEWATEKKCAKIGVPTGDLGPGSYGAGFHDFPMPNGKTFNQLSHIVTQLRNPRLHQRRTLIVNPWIPFYNGWGGIQKAVVSPCHGWLHFRVINGGLFMRMDQRSADMPIGVPANMIQYFALLLAVAQVSGLKPTRFCHSFSDAHIYENQREEVEALLERNPFCFPTLTIDPEVKELSDFRPHHFELSEYESHDAVKIAVSV